MVQAGSTLNCTSVVLQKKKIYSLFSPVNWQSDIYMWLQTRHRITRGGCQLLKWCVKQTQWQRCNGCVLVAGPVNCKHLNFAVTPPLPFPPPLPSPLISSFLRVSCIITYPAKNMRRNHEPGTANVSIASSACRFPAIRHGIHARMSRLLITNINLAGSWLWNANVRRNVSAAACTLATFQERPQRNRYFRVSSISPYDLTASMITSRAKFAQCAKEWKYFICDFYYIMCTNILYFLFFFSNLFSFTSIGNVINSFEKVYINKCIIFKKI